MRFTVAPMDAGPAEDMAEIIEWLGSDELLMFATDYPHGHELPFDLLLGAMPEAMRPKLMAENARRLYRLGGAAG
jgi:predicted TIM-barrel fold metal-dependent hydrolase